VEGEVDFQEALLVASRNIGSLLCDGIGDAVLVQGENAPGQSFRLSYNILQASGARIFKTDYVACPSCGRTLFNLQSTTQKIRAATGHLKGVRIAVMSMAQGKWRMPILVMSAAHRTRSISMSAKRQ
jgi:(E)-4-hydroxy-3-methylbut-2-enyl-diphosphate synthase